MKTCRDCQSAELVPRGKKGYRNQCHACWAKTQREAWARNRDARLVTSKRQYAKHAAKRRAESAAHKAEHREYYALAEWLRKRGVPISHVDRADVEALVSMKRALNEAKALMRSRPPTPATTAAQPINENP